MARDTVGRTFLVAGILCVVCSVVVSAAAVGLRGLQDANRQLDIRKNILQVAGLREEGGDINELYEANVDQQLIDLASGQAADQQVVDAASYIPLDAAKDPDYSTAIQPELDVAGIKRRENFAFVYRVMEEGRVSKFILPIYGKGLWSTLYGFLALDADLQTVRGITFYKHGETAGLGGEVDNPRWKASWDGKLLFDDDGQIKLEVMKGAVNQNDADAAYKVDGLSGATITSRGVSNLVRYWLGPDAFGPFLQNQQQLAP